MNQLRIKIISLTFIFFLILVVFPVKSQEEQSEESAEINAYIEGDISSIEVENWTSINIVVVDAFGINWPYLQEAIPEWWMRIIWPFNPSFPQPVQRFLGETSFRFEPEIVEGDPRGWSLRMRPSAVSGSVTGDVYNISLEALTDDSAVDYAVVVGIKCTRIDTLGGEIGSSYIYIPIKAAPANYVEMRAQITQKKSGPKALVYFDVDITNNGYYRDVFQFDLDEENGLLALPTEQIITLDPLQTKRVSIGVLTPEKFFDVGTPSKINVYIYSSGNSTKTFIGSLVIITEGFYFSPLIGIIAAPILIIILLLFLYFIFIQRKRDEERFGPRPKKPWTLPEEKQRLDELKTKDKKLYDQELLKMKDDYTSALVMYKDQRNKQRPQKKSIIQRIVPVFQRKEKPKKEEKKPLPKQIETPKKPKKEKKGEAPKKVKKTKGPVKEPLKKEELLDGEREKTLRRIQREQEKQKKKLRA